MPCSTTKPRSFANLNCAGLRRLGVGCTNRRRWQDIYSRCLMNIVGSDVKGALRALWPDDLSPILTSPTAPQMQHLYEPTALRGGVLTLLCQKGCAPDFLCRYAFQIRAAHVAGWWALLSAAVSTRRTLPSTESSLLEGSGRVDPKYANDTLGRVAIAMGYVAGEVKGVASIQRVGGLAESQVEASSIT